MEQPDTSIPTSSSLTRLAMEVRLLDLESRIRGPPSYDTSSPSTGSAHPGLGNDAAYRGKTAVRRVNDITAEIGRLGEESEALKRFLDNYDSYRPLLTTPSVDASSVLDHPISASDPSNPDGTSTVPAATTSLTFDLVPNDVKKTMLLEAAPDIIALERDLRKLETYKDRGAEGAGQLEHLLQLRPRITALEATRRDQRTDFERVRRDVGQTLTRYSTYNNTISELFLDIHHRLEAVEDIITKAERKKRQELAQRY